MTAIREHIAAIRSTLPEGVTLVCVSKFQPVEAIREAYECGERDFGESRVQELLAKHAALPDDIRWHFIGHLQTNKVREILPFVHLIQSVDSVRLLDCINREAERIGKRVNVLLEVHVARENSKSGFMPDELPGDFTPWPWVNICGLMGMATNTDDETEIRRCFRTIKSLNDTINSQTTHNPMVHISMGMSDDYRIAIGEGGNMVRIGSTIFGQRITIK